MKAKLISSLEFKSEVRTETYSTNFDFDIDFNLPDLMLDFCETIKKCLANVDDDIIIKVLESNLEFYIDKRNQDCIKEQEESILSKLKINSKGINRENN